MQESEFSGARLRQFREDIGMRQADLAKAAGISASYLNLIEHGRRRISGALVGRLAQALKVRPEELEEGQQRVLVEQLEAAALQVQASAKGAGALAARHGNWAEVITRLARRAEDLGAQNAALRDRLAHDPEFAAALHDVLSVVTSLRSTASILVKDEGIDADWQARFHSNMFNDARRLADGVQGLIEAMEEQTAQTQTPQQEFAAWVAAHGGHLPGFEAGAAPDVSDLSADAQALAAPWLQRYARDAEALPGFAAVAQAHGYDPFSLAATLNAPFAQVLRRLASLPPGGPDRGLFVYDGSGALLYRHPLRQTDPTPPLAAAFGALQQPGRPVVSALSTPGGPVECVAIAEVAPPAEQAGVATIEVTILVSAA